MKRTKEVVVVVVDIRYVIREKASKKFFFTFPRFTASSGRSLYGEFKKGGGAHLSKVCGFFTFFGKGEWLW